MHLCDIYLYPVKSCAALAVDAGVVEPRGLQGDRRWMVVDAEGRFLTGRQLPRLTLLRARPEGDGLCLEAPGVTALRVPFPAAGDRATVVVWGSEVAARRAGGDADAWLSQFLDQSVRLVHMDEGAARPISGPFSRPGDEVSFADGFPLLLVSQAAVEDLNARLATPVSMLRFRPNLVVDGVPAHAEDGWKRIRIGEVEFEVAKACARCVFTTVDPVRGERDPGGEPLRTLVGYRRTPDGVTFGQNLIARTAGSVRVGDAVQVLA